MSDHNFKVKGESAQDYGKESRDNINVNVRKSNNKKTLKIVIVIFVFLCIFLLIFFLKWGKKEEKYVPTKAEEEQFVTPSSKTEFFKNINLNDDPEPPDSNVNQSESNDSESNDSSQQSTDNQVVEDKKDDNENKVILIPSNPSDQTSRSNRNEITSEERKLMGSMLVTNNITSEPAEVPKTVSDNNFLQSKSTYADGTVSFIKNTPFLLSAGTVIPCVLKTKIVTSYPAITLCQITKNIYSDDGKNILIRSGALVQGEQTQVMMQGIARVFVNWNTVKDGDLSVQINALAADGLGASGIPAWVDNHFWSRFGGALMLSFIDDALAAAATHAQKQNENVSVDNIRNTGSTMAEIALENSINIAPTAYINQGTMLSIIVPRNTDFSKVLGR